MMISNQIEGGVILFHFRDGPRQGDVVRSDVQTDRDSTNEAVTFWAMSRGGTVGRTIKTTHAGTLGELLVGGLSLEGKPSRNLKHLYRVVERVEEPQSIQVFVEYVKTLS
ncbi:MAG: hypothetical protein R3C05_25105 [Pirellulaceae bacterium]